MERPWCIDVICFILRSISSENRWVMMTISLMPGHLFQIDTSKLQVIWSDAHQSEYSLDWLCKHQFTEAGIEARAEHHRLSRCPWGTQMVLKIPTLDFTKVQFFTLKVSNTTKYSHVIGKHLDTVSSNISKQSLCSVHR